MSINGKITRFLKERQPPTPCLVVDLDVVRGNYRALQRSLPCADVYYAVKANPAPKVLQSLLALGARFDAASYEEIDLCLKLGADPAHVSWGNTIKRESEIACAQRRGIRLFAFDCGEELAKIARAAPGARVFCRLHAPQNGAACPVSDKFGCSPNTACRLLLDAAALGLEPWGLSFHVGSQQTDVASWVAAVDSAARIFKNLQTSGLNPPMLNLGGGFPVRYSHDVPDVDACCEAIGGALARRFGNALPEVVTEPGRAIVASAGVIQSEVLLVSRREADDPLRWVYIDVGRSSGLVESVNNRIVYPLLTPYDDDDVTGPACLAGPTCDWSDVINNGALYQLPLSLKAGDRVLLANAGAYTETCSTVGFNGFAPLKGYYL